MNKPHPLSRWPYVAIGLLLLPLLYPGIVQAATKVRDYVIVASTIDSSIIGGTTPAAITGTTIQATTGIDGPVLTINHQAPAGHVLIGSGSSYVDAQVSQTGNLAGGARNINGVYQNGTNQTMLVDVTSNSCCGGLQAYELDGHAGSNSAPGIVKRASTSNGTGIVGISFVVPPGYYYSVTSPNGMAIAIWVETLQ